MDFVGKTMVVIGGSGELGSRIATGLAAGGAGVFSSFNSRRRETPIGENPITHFHLDLMNPESIESGSKDLMRDLDSISGIVIASGVVGFNPAEEVTFEQSQRMMQINHLGPSQFIAGLSEKLKLSQGVVVGISGIVADQTFPGMSSYCASKAAHAAYLQTLNKEWRKHKIRVLDFRIGHTETGLASRPQFGVAPAMPTGHDPEAVVRAILEKLDQPSGIFRDSDLGI